MARNKSHRKEDPRQDQRDLKDSRTFSKLWNEFAQDTALHGLNKLPRNAHSFCRSVFWTFAVLACAVYLVYTLYVQILTFFTYPTLTNTKTELVTEQQFPAVTVCNLSPKSKQKIGNDSRLANYWTALSFYPFLSEPIDWSDNEYKLQGYFEPRTLQDIYNESDTIEELILYHRFEYKLYSRGEDCSPRPTLLGLCYTWNKNGTINTRVTGSLRNFGLHANIQQDNYFYGFFSEAGLKVIIHDADDEPDVFLEGLVVAPGNAAFIKIKQTQYEYQARPYHAVEDGYCKDTSSPDYDNYVDGRKYSYNLCRAKCVSDTMYELCGCIHMGDPGGYPRCSLYQHMNCYHEEWNSTDRAELTDEEYVNVTVSYLDHPLKNEDCVKLSVYKTKTYADQFKFFPPIGADVMKQEDKEHGRERTSKVSTKNLKKPSHTSFIIADTKNVTPYASEKLGVQSSTVNLMNNDTFFTKCKCEVPCMFTKYETEMSLAQYPSDLNMKFLTERGIFGSEEEIRKNHLTLTIFYENLFRRSVIQMPEYSSFVDIIAKLGGEMGLLLGASILCFVEIMEFMLKVFVFLFEKCYLRLVQVKPGPVI